MSDFEFYQGAQSESTAPRVTVRRGGQLVLTQAAAWIEARGPAPGPLFCPVGQTGTVRTTPMRGESIAYILKRRQEQAGATPFSPHGRARR